MGIASFPAASGGLSSAIKSIQRGTAGGAGNITITAVTTAKTTVNSFSTSSAGTVAATGTVGAQTGTIPATWNLNTTAANPNPYYTSFQSTGEQYAYYVATRYSGYTQYVAFPAVSWNYNSNNSNLSGGTTDLTTKAYGAYLVDSTTIYATGPCQYEVIEYN
jgi:hypothetical protein